MEENADEAGRTRTCETRDEVEEAGGRSRRDGRRRALLATVLNEGKPKDIILKVPKSVFAKMSQRTKAKLHSSPI